MTLHEETLRIARSIRERVGPFATVVLPDDAAVAAELQKMPLRELAALASAPAPRPSLTLNDLASVVLELPTQGSKLRDVERAIIAHALAVSGGNKTAAARLLGMERKAFARKARRLRA